MNPLHIPLSSLPAPVQIGAPLVLPTAHGDLYAIVPPEAVPFLLAGDGWCIDLSPPPIDADGHPARIDALPVLVDMLARARGHAPGQHVLMRSRQDPHGWVIETWRDDGTKDQSCFSAAPIGCRTMLDFSSRPCLVTPPVPALASVDPTDPLSPRYTCVALVAARVWETA